MSKSLDSIASDLRARLDSIHIAREQALAMGRRIIQGSSKSIKCLHRRQQDEAQVHLADVANEIGTLNAALDSYPQLRLSPSVQDSIKEYVEATTLAALIRGDELPTPDELGVEPAAYLNGLCEAASECRRAALDSMRSGNEEYAFSLCDKMEDIYDELITFDYPDAVTSNLRRSVDALRAVLERTRSDLAVTSTQKELIEELRKANESKG